LVLHSIKNPVTHWFQVVCATIALHSRLAIMLTVQTIQLMATH